MVLLSFHAVAKCGVASGRPAFMGGLSPVLYRLIVPARHAKNITNFGADKILASALNSPYSVRSAPNILNDFKHMLSMHLIF
jgi:hypothetical protein